jgi:uncharacterized DUF497 family protein
MEMQFEWDPDKAAGNIAKHAISFEDAVTVFKDTDYFAFNVTKPEHGEVRYLAVGMMHDGGMAAVVYTIRESKRRIISARNVRKNEQREYDNRKASPQRYGRPGSA